MEPGSWSKCGAVSPDELVEARLALHYAAQPLAAAAAALLPASEDHTHTNLLWNDARHGFVSRPFPGGSVGFLDFVPLRIGLLSSHGDELETIELAGKTLAEVLSALSEALVGVGEVVAGSLELPCHDLPPFAVGAGEAFAEPDGAHNKELARWFANGVLILSALAIEDLEGAEVRTWPHHFDCAALHVLDAPDQEADPERARSLNVGFSPGDGTVAQPYFYVTPWPAPPASKLPELTAGMHWHTDGFTAAILPAQDVVRLETSRGQKEFTRAAMDEALEACRVLLERPSRAR